MSAPDSTSGVHGDELTPPTRYAGTPEERTDELSPESAMEVVARHIVYVALTDSIDDGIVGWENFPDIGEHDWEAVTKRAKALAEEFKATQGAFVAAYGVLAARAEPEPS